MIVIPAIDIRAGKVVRLKQGRLESEKVYGSDPVDVAKKWEAEGAVRVHVVDLDAAIEGRPQPDVLGAIIRGVKIAVEVAGGLRELDHARRYKDEGADRVIFGTAALARPEIVQEAARLWAESVAVALDARNGKVAVAGWLQVTTVNAVDLAMQAKGWRVPRIQYTDVVRDGTLSGPNFAGVEQIARASGLRVTAAGGIATLEDLRKLHDLTDAGVDEVIVGKALYERRFSLAEAVAAARPDGDAA